MNLPLFIAHRIYSDDGDHRKVSRPAIRIATIGVAIGLAVMIITVSVVLGFKHTIRDKVVGFGSHIQVESFIASQSATPYPVCVDDSLMNVLEGINGVRHVGRYALTQGISAYSYFCYFVCVNPSRLSILPHGVSCPILAHASCAVPWQCLQCACPCS